MPDLQRRTLPAGTVISVYGVPLQLTADVEAETHADNWKLIERRDVDLGNPVTKYRSSLWRRSPMLGL